ncbi:MAG: hypothetical protein HY300_11360, partial [Verrucomicrobia bacterium]|nr:hypothetical protein [Verrucomicrobiota bacterium]
MSSTPLTDPPDAAAAEHAVVTDASRPARSLGAEEVKPRVRRLLVVDDDEMNRDLLRQRLEREGFFIATA